MTRVQYLGLVPARSGSKGLPGKNLRPLGNRPLLQYTLEAGLASRRLNRVILSSDDERMMALARHLGCEVPFRRPAALAEDSTPMVDVALHAVEWLARELDLMVDVLVLLQPTQPFRAASDIDAAIDAFERAGTHSLMSVEEAAQHPCECVTLADGRLQWARERPDGVTGRQEFPPFYFVNGAIYITTVAFLREHRSFHSERSSCHVMPRARGLDINDLHDFHIAEGLVRLAASGVPVFDHSLYEASQ